MKPIESKDAKVILEEIKTIAEDAGVELKITPIGQYTFRHLGFSLNFSPYGCDNSCSGCSGCSGCTGCSNFSSGASYVDFLQPNKLAELIGRALAVYKSSPSSNE